MTECEPLISTWRWSKDPSDHRPLTWVNDEATTCGLEVNRPPSQQTSSQVKLGLLTQRRLNKIMILPPPVPVIFDIRRGLVNNRNQFLKKTSWTSHINVCKVKVKVNVKMAYRCSKFNGCLMLIACLVLESIQRWCFVCLCRPTVTLHQGQGHQNEHEHNYRASISLPYYSAAVSSHDVNNCNQFQTNSQSKR